MKEIIVCSDLDGSLYDTFHYSFCVANKMLKHYNLQSISEKDYKKLFRSNDWDGLYRDLGFPNELIKEAQKWFISNYRDMGMAHLIPGAKDLILGVEQIIGMNNFYILTNDPRNNVEPKFIRDGLEKYLPRVHHPFQGKAVEIFNLAGLKPNMPFLYFGDLVCDGEECREARKMGALNVRFLGLAHEYSMNHPEDVLEYCSRHTEFATSVQSLGKIIDFILEIKTKQFDGKF